MDICIYIEHINQSNGLWRQDGGKLGCDFT